VLPGRAYQLEDVLHIAWRRKWIILVPFVLLSAAIVLFSRSLPNQYRSETLILVVPQRVPESYVRSTVTYPIEDRLKSLQQQILSRSRLEPIIVDLNLYPHLRSTMTMEELVRHMRAAPIKVETVRGDAFTVSFVSHDPVTAQRVTTRLASAFIEENVRERASLADGTSEFLQVQLDEARRRLIEQEQKLEHYRIAHSGEMPSQTSANLQAVQSGRLQLQSVADSLNRYRDRQAALERQLADLLAPDAVGMTASSGSGVSGAAPGAGSPGNAATPTELLEDARRQLRDLEERRFTAQHPDVVALKRRIRHLEETVPARATGRGAEPVQATAARSTAELLRERRVREVRDELQALDRNIQLEQSKEQRLHEEIAVYQARLEAAPIRESELTELTRDYETLQDIYRTLLAKREDSKIAANLERRQVGEQFKVLDPARVPERPFSPDRQKINLAGIVCGLLVGLGLAGLLEYTDSTLKTEDDIRQVLALPVLALVPVMKAARGSRRPRAETRWPFAAALAALVRMWPW
jgi:polysaccharide chain length determinant protein (PEP-CTERM system associated)